MSENRDLQAESIIGEHMRLALVAGAIPLPLLDLSLVSFLQVEMIRKLAKVYDIDFDQERTKALISAMFTSFLMTTLPRVGASALKLTPLIGTLVGSGISAVTSAAATYALGKVFQGHFQQKGDLFSFDWNTVRSKFEDFFKKGEEVAKQAHQGSSPQEIMDTIARLNELKKQGALTEEEFNKLKAELLAKII